MKRDLQYRISCLLIVGCFTFHSAFSLTFVVTNTLDSGPGSFRDAILQSNGNFGIDNIAFSIPGTGVQTIYPFTPLPSLSDVNGVTIDGYTQPGSQPNTNPPGIPSNAILLIQINGMYLPAGDGLTIESLRNTVRGLVINGFSRGIVIAGNQSRAGINSILGCYIGTNPQGTAAIQNSLAGIQIGGLASLNSIGDGTPGGRCLISGNQNGIMITGNTTTTSMVYGNYIGTNVYGTTAIGNWNAGVLIMNGATSNQIGGQTTSTRNITSGNGYGVMMTDIGTSWNAVINNYIGTDVAGITPVGNQRSGVRIENGASNNSIGSYQNVQLGNLISGNGGPLQYSGLDIKGPATSGNIVEANFIGTDQSGATAIPNTGAGVSVFNGAANNQIGVDNVISGNTKNGILVSDAGTDNNTIINNHIGLNGTGSSAIPNVMNGVLIELGAQANKITGVWGPGLEQCISGNLQNGIWIRDNGSINTLIQGNYIGMDRNSLAHGNGGHGIYLSEGADFTQIDGILSMEGNRIGFNSGHGILIEDVHNTAVTSVNGLIVLPFDGLNKIFQNGGDGIAVTGSNALNNTFSKNEIHDNAGLGIDLGNNNVTLNDPGDPDPGANKLLNYPVITTATWTDGWPNSTTFIAGTLDIESNPSLAVVEVFGMSAADPSGFGEGNFYVASFTPDPLGNWSGTVTGIVTAGNLLSATTTDMFGNTSEFSQVFRILAFDFGDAPDPFYPTKFANNGAQHSINWNVYLGNMVDAEPDGFPDPNSMGDDLQAFDDEDGVTFSFPLVQGSLAPINVTASMAGKLNAWIDFNGDNDWSDAGEQIFTDLPLLAGANALSTYIPLNAATGNTFARFRFNLQGGLSFTGTATDGEVEDYKVLIGQQGMIYRDFGDAPEGAIAYPLTGVFGAFPTCQTMGPAGWIEHNSSGLWFGNSVDIETDGNAGLCPVFQNNLYDQDECFMDGDAGLVKPSSFTFTGTPSNLAIVPCSGANAIPLGNACGFASWGPNIDISVRNMLPLQGLGFFNLLIDWNQDGQWSGNSVCPGGAPMDEHVLKNFIIPPNFNTLLGALNPPQILIGPNSGFFWMRFSITDVPVALPWDGSGVFADGETEDYLVLVNPGQPIPDSLLVQNVTIPSGTTICYEALQKITVAGNGTYVTIQSGANVHMIAGQRILILDGTTVQSGGDLHAYITTNYVYCSNPLKFGEGEENPNGVYNLEEITKAGTGLKVYPNPTSGTFTVEQGQLTTKGVIVMEIYDLLGEKVLHEEVAGQTSAQISLALQPRGVYILRVIVGKEVYTVKVVKQ